MSSQISKNQLQALTAFKDKKHRKRKGKVILEGLRLMNQLALFGVLPRELFHLPDFDLNSLSLGASIKQGKILSFEAEAHQLKRFCDTDSPPNVAGLYDLPTEQKVDFRKAFYLDSISDPGNLGTIFRLGKAFGLDAILLSEDCAEIGSPKVIRASLGAVYELPFCYVPADKLEPEKYQIIGTDAFAKLSLRQFTLSKNKGTLFVLGSEAHGMSPQIRQLCHQIIKIEMQQTSESVNVAVAAGIIAHFVYTAE